MGEGFRRVVRHKLDDLHELEVFANICAKALGGAVHAVRAVEWQIRAASALGKPLPFSSDEESEKAKVHAAEVVKFAEFQRDNGLPYLFGLCSVRLWALLEALVDEIATQAMQEPESCKDQAILSKLKGPLIPFRNATAEEQAEFLGETLKQAVDAPLKTGVARFEAILEPIGLGGVVGADIRRLLFELSRVRNVLVHKGGRADNRLVESCPWLGMRRGEPTNITGRMFGRYMLAAWWYFMELAGRAAERAGEERATQLVELQTDLLAEITRQLGPRG